MNRHSVFSLAVCRSNKAEFLLTGAIRTAHGLDIRALLWKGTFLFDSGRSINAFVALVPGAVAGAAARVESTLCFSLVGASHNNADFLLTVAIRTAHGFHVIKALLLRALLLFFDSGLSIHTLVTLVPGAIAGAAARVEFASCLFLLVGVSHNKAEFLLTGLIRTAHGFHIVKALLLRALLLFFDSGLSIHTLVTLVPGAVAGAAARVEFASCFLVNGLQVKTIQKIYLLTSFARHIGSTSGFPKTLTTTWPWSELAASSGVCSGTFMSTALSLWTAGAPMADAARARRRMVGRGTMMGTWKCDRYSVG